MKFPRFIYVFCAGARDSLLGRGWILIQKDERQKVWIFENKGVTPFLNEEYSYVLSDVISF